MSPNQTVALRAGAILSILASIVLVGFAVTIDAHPKTTLTVAQDSARIDLPKPGLFGGEVTVYAQGAVRRASPQSLRCVLVSKAGREQSSAKMSSLAVTVRHPKAGPDGYVPVFTVGDYPKGSRLACAKAAKVDLAVSNPTTFGTLAPTVKVATAGFALVAFTLGAGALLVMRRRDRTLTA